MNKFQTILLTTITLAGTVFSKELLLDNSDTYTVPTGKKWEISTPSPVNCDMCTADLYLEGEMSIGNITQSGTIEMSFNSGTPSKIILFSHTKVTVGDSRGKIKVNEIGDALADAKSTNEKWTLYAMTSRGYHCADVIVEFVPDQGRYYIYGTEADTKKRIDIGKDGEEVLVEINSFKSKLMINKEGKLGGKTTYDQFRKEFQKGGSINFTKVSDGSWVFGSMIDVK